MIIGPIRVEDVDVVVALKARFLTNLPPWKWSVPLFTDVPLISTSARSFKTCAPELEPGVVFNEINSSVSFTKAASSNTIVDPLVAVNSDSGNLTPLRNTST